MLLLPAGLYDAVMSMRRPAELVVSKRLPALLTVAGALGGEQMEAAALVLSVTGGEHSTRKELISASVSETTKGTS